MWLLDANMPVQLVALLHELGIEADTAVARGWNTLGNGSLVAMAVQENFAVLLTRDRLFGEAAATALKAFPEFVLCVWLCRSFAPTPFFKRFELRGGKLRSLQRPAG